MDKKFQEAFDEIRAEKELKERTKQSLYAQLQTKNAHNTPNTLTTGTPPTTRTTRRHFPGTNTLRYGTVAVMLTIFIIIGIFNRSVDAQASYIRLEGDISVGISLDDSDMVIAVQGLNEQGEQLLRQLHLEGMSYREAVDCIMESKMKITGDKSSAATSVTVEGEDEEKCGRLEAEVSKQCSDHEKKHSSSGKSTHTELREHNSSEGQKSNSGRHKAESHHSQNRGGKGHRKGTER